MRADVDGVAASAAISSDPLATCTGSPVSQDRPPRCRPLPPDVVARVAAQEPGVADAQLLERVEQALLSLPDDERTAVVSSVMYADSFSAAAAELGVAPDRAEALTRQGLQHLRAVLDDAPAG